MDIGLIIVLLHVLTAGWFVGGLVGRNVTFGYARVATKLETTIALLRASEHFERRMVMPGSMMILLLGLIAAWLRGWPILGFLQGGSSNWVLASLIIYLGLVPFIPLTVAPRLKVREELVEAALAEGRITEQLTAALNDKVVLRYRAAEVLVVLVITVLMVTKPF